MKFIKLTTIKGKDSFYINTDFIESVDNTGGCTKIFMLGSTSGDYYGVKETPEEILRMIDGEVSK